MTSIASSASYTSADEDSSSRLSHSSHSLESRGTRGSVGSRSTTSRSASSRTSKGSRSTTTSRSTASKSSRSSRTSASSRYSHSEYNAHTQTEGGSNRLSTIHSVTSEEEEESYKSQDYSTSAYSSEATSYASNILSVASSNRAELSLPSSFGGSAYHSNRNRALVKTEDGVVSIITTQDAHTDDDEGSLSINTETQLALRVEKETKPMMHLVKLLKEMDTTSTTNNDDNADSSSKYNAIHSLIEEFEEEVVEIEQRIVNPLLTNGQEDENDDDEEELQQIMEELPRDWIALVDPDSGDVYYSNEVTGETTWDKPEMPKQLQIEPSNDYDRSDSQDDSYRSNYEENDDQSSYEEQEEDDDDEEEEEELPPDWVALEDPDSGDVYYANEVTGESTWDRPRMTKEERQRLDQQQQQEQQQHENQPQSQEPQRAPDLNNDSNYSNDYQTNNKEPNQSPADDEISADDSLPSDWIPLIDPDSGDTYFCNEITGETTWDKPQFDEEEKIERRRNKNLQRDDDVVEVDRDEQDEDEELIGEYEKDAGLGDNVDEDLPDGWFSIVDPDSGDVYYSNEITGETTWDKPVDDDTSTYSPENNDQPMQQQQQRIQHEQNSPEFNRGESNNSGSVNNHLPPGWISSIDPDSGNEYYFNEETGETTWDKPESSQLQQIEQQHGDSSADFPPSDSEWFPVVDPQSGDTYYANENTGETSWEKPVALLRLESEPYNNQELDETRLLTNSPAHHDEHDLPPGWFTATDPQSGEEYYVNEQTGETTWDKPLPQNTNHTPLLSNQPASEDEASLASGWFAVVEPVSGDIYYANEQTGATSWEKPRKQANTSNHMSLQSFAREPQHDQSSHGLSKMNLSMHENTVYEGDSVTSSQY